MPSTLDNQQLKELLSDPISFIKLCWPSYVLYPKQAEILYSVRDNDETVVPAGNQLGKDFTAGIVCVWYFVSRPQCRIVTTSVDAKHLEVLWSEIKRHITESRFKLPIQVNHMHIRKLDPKGINGLDDLSYLIGRVAEKGEGLLGHHLPKTRDGGPCTMAVFDEASGGSDEGYVAVDTWAHRKLIFGNPRPCENFFKKAVKQGDLKNPDGSNYWRKVIRIRAVDSPAVKRGISLEAKGLPPDNSVIIPGVIDYNLYKKRVATYDPIRTAWSIDGLFYEGSEVLLYPPQWLDYAEEVHRSLCEKRIPRIAKSIGVDVAEGGDDTVWTIIDRLGVIKQVAMKTPDTSVIPGQTIAFIKEYNLDPEFVQFDAGGGGRQWADYLRKIGYNVRSVPFGATAVPLMERQGIYKSIATRTDQMETRYTYLNRRCEMYGMLRFNLLDPINKPSFGIPAEMTELRRQLSPVPLQYDPVGRLYLPPKNKKPGSDSKEMTMVDILGCSPDHSDSLVLAVYGLFVKPIRRAMGAMA